ncbi:AsnC family protein [Actinomadura namibiensis]|uniref:AsnC family protein n=1 Tax=Actinomadura kijaniata TaxID=46161 RepID=UPI001C723752
MPPARAADRGAGGRAPPTDAERALIDALRHDGRATHADLAGATGWSPDTVARRLAALRARGRSSSTSRSTTPCSA